MRSTRSLTLAAYLVALMLVLIPFSELLLGSLPLRPASVTWRFATGAGFSRALMTPLLGVLLASGIAQGLGQRRMLRALSGLSAALLLVVLFVAARFLLDTATMRAGAGPDAQPALGIASVPVLMKMLLSAVVAALLALGDWRLADAPESEQRSVEPKGSRTKPPEAFKSAASSTTLIHAGG